VKTAEEMSALEKRTLARWIRDRMRHSVSQETLEKIADEDLLSHYFREHTERMKRAAKAPTERSFTVATSDSKDPKMVARAFLTHLANGKLCGQKISQ
jgi:hypothetical protein